VKSKKPRKNIRRGKKNNRHIKFFQRLKFGFNVCVGIIVLAATTCVFIIVHDVLTHSEYFKAEKLTIKGSERLAREQIVRQAQVHAGVNILAVNLSLTRRRLLEHPWIAEAEVSREIPSGLSIQIQEHTPMAVIDVGRKLLINRQGEIFKEWDSSDPTHLPVISGLDLTDFRIHGHPTPIERRGEPEAAAPVAAVMRVLQMGEENGSILPNRFIKQIQVDRQIGLTLYVFDSAKKIKLGFDNYAGKYHLLANLFEYLKRQRRFADFKRIDLNNVERVVVNPLRPK